MLGFKRRRTNLVKNRFWLTGIFALVSLAGWTVHAQLQKSNSQRPTWEYKTVVLNRTIIRPELSWMEDGKELPGSPNMDLKARELGDQGWELVSMTTLSSQTGQGFTGFTNTIVYWFKRPK
jgi:hypothetical protein